MIRQTRYLEELRWRRRHVIESRRFAALWITGR
jgi:hypothetical protein